MDILIEEHLFEAPERIDENSSLIKAKCLTCVPPKKISSVIGNLSNYLKHLKRLHTKEYQIYLKAKTKSTIKNYSKCSSEICSLEKSYEGKSFQNIAEESIISFIVGTMAPLSTVESEEFQNMISVCSQNKVEVISKSTLAQRINYLYTQKMETLTKTLCDIKDVCTTVDVWSINKRSFLGCAVTWLNPITLERQSGALSCIRFKGSHSYEKIVNVLQEINSTFMIENKITKILTDNGSTFMKHFRELGFKLDSDPNEILVLEKNDDTYLLPDADYETEDYTDKDNELEFIEIESRNDVAWSYTLPSREKCYSHILSLVATTDIECANLNPYQRKVKEDAIGKLSTLFNKNNQLKSSEIIKDYLEKPLITPCLTKWCSIYDSFVVVIEFGIEKINNLLNLLSVSTLNENEFLFISEYCYIVKPIVIGLRKLQSDKSCYFGYVLPVIRQISLELDKLNSELVFAGPILEAAKNGLQNRFDGILEQDIFTHQDAILATITLPCFKLKPILCQKREEAKNLLINECLNLRKSKQNINQSDDQKQQEDYFTFDFNEDVNVKENINELIEMEVFNFLQSTDSKLEELKDYPNVRDVFIKYNTALSSSAPVESLFNYETMVRNCKKNRLTNENFEVLLVLKANQHF